MSISSKTLSDTIAILEKEDWKDPSFHMHMGGFTIDEPYEDEEAYKSLKYIIKEHNLKLKKVTWGDIVKLIRDDKFFGWNALQSQAFGYQYFLPHGYTYEEENPQLGHMGMDFKNSNDEYENIVNHVDESDDPTIEANINSIYYHAAKAHWLVNSIRKEGLWNPIQGRVVKVQDKYRLEIHPGSVRSPVFECLDDWDMEMWIWDDHDIIPVPEIEIEEIIDWAKEKILANPDKYHKNISFAFVHGYVEILTDLLQMTFRTEVYDFNKKINKLAKNKHLNVYIGYDSRHQNLAELNKKCIEHSTRYGAGGGTAHDLMNKWKPEINFLDISKIPEYTRDYANQSTEFTYSRFLIPYLENYEGFSIFLDDDILFTKSLWPMFYFLDPDDAVACIQYDFDKYPDTKFDGEKNVSYPKKLWSSLMIFNNGHEDCKKLTPEIVNTESGKFLHQFEWTDKISQIPEHYVFTEGHDTRETNWRPSAIHYTRGGPWIEGMDITEIDELNTYRNLLNRFS